MIHKITHGILWSALSIHKSRNNEIQIIGSLFYWIWDESVERLYDTWKNKFIVSCNLGFIIEQYVCKLKLLKSTILYFRRSYEMVNGVCLCKSSFNTDYCGWKVTLNQQISMEISCIQYQQNCETVNGMHGEVHLWSLSVPPG